MFLFLLIIRIPIVILLIIGTPPKHVVQVLHHASTVASIAPIVPNVLIIVWVIDVDIILVSHLLQNGLLHGEEFIFSHVLEVSILDQGELLVLLLLLHHHVLLVPGLRLVKLVDHMLNLLVSNSPIPIRIILLLTHTTTTSYVRLSSHHKLLGVDGSYVICEVRLLQRLVSRESEGRLH